MKALFPLFVLFILSSCALFTKRLSKAYPMKVKPDYSCTIGNGESGTFYYLWECYEGRRVLLYNKGSGIYWSSNHREVGRCGEKTSYELKNHLDIKDKAKCHERHPYPYQITGNEED